MAFSNLGVDGPGTNSHVLEIVRTPTNCLMLPEYVSGVSVLGLSAVSLNPHSHCRISVLLLCSVEKKTDSERWREHAPGCN